MGSWEGSTAHTGTRSRGVSPALRERLWAGSTPVLHGSMLFMRCISSNLTVNRLGLVAACREA